MANRYWAGGTGTWNTSSTANWSAASPVTFIASCTGTTLTTTGSPALVVGMTVWSSTSVSLGTVVSGSVNTWVVSVGGTYASQAMQAATIGASVPTAADSVIFEPAFTYTVTCTGALTCLDITVSAGIVTFATGTTPTFAISGSMSLVAATVWSATGAITFNATATGKTVTTNGVSLSAAITFNGVGGGWTLGSALTTTGTVTFTAGTFSTGNFACTNTSWASSNSNTRSVSLGSSTVTLSSGSSTWNFATTTSLTFNAGTSTITLSNSVPIFSGGGLTYNNVTFSNVTGSTVTTITGANTFNNLTITGGSTSVRANVSISAAQTISSTFTVTGASQPARLFIYSSVFGTARTITTAVVSLTNVDFRDITTAGAAGTWTGASIGNCYGNTGITFTAAKTVYWNLAGAQNWTATGWCTASGGTPAIANFPIPQDTAVIDQNSAITTLSVNGDMNIGTLDMSLRTSAMTLATSVNNLFIYGSWKNGTGVTISGLDIITFAGRSITQQITSNSVVFTQPITINCPSGIVQCTDALSIGTTNTLTFTLGTLQLAASATSTVGSFVTSGTTLKYLQSTTSGTQATLSDASGTNTATYLSIQDSNATGGATFDASSATNVNAGNNSGWTGFVGSFPGNFFFMFR